MKTFFIATAIYFTFLNALSVFSQNAIITKSVLSELDYFNSFMDKFYPYTSEHVYVIKIDSSQSDFSKDSKDFLVSVLYNNELIKYIQPNYAFFYANNWYVVKTEMKIYGEQAVELKDYKKARRNIKKFGDRIIQKRPIVKEAFFPYCFFFKTSKGKVVGGMDIGSCDPYFNSTNNNSFFYNNADIERVEGEKY